MFCLLLVWELIDKSAFLQIIEVLDDGALSVMDDETGNTRYDLSLPSGDLSKDIKDRFEKQETLYVSDSCSTLSLQISAVICLIDCRYGVKPFILPLIEILKFDWLRQILYAAILCFLTNLIFLIYPLHVTY